MRNLKEWFSANELIEIDGLPNTPQGINKKARTQQWKKRNKDGVQGGAVEYHYSSFPPEVQKVLGFEPFQLFAPPAISYENSAEELAISHEAMLDKEFKALKEARKMYFDLEKLDHFERFLIDLYRKLSNEEKLELLNYTKALSDKQEKKEAERDIAETEPKVA